MTEAGIPKLAPQLSGVFWTIKYCCTRDFRNQTRFFKGIGAYITPAHNPPDGRSFAAHDAPFSDAERSPAGVERCIHVRLATCCGDQPQTRPEKIGLF